jgi:glycosyltransferase involved in cell wall biosynthesis
MLVSVVVCTYNRADLLKGCLGSLARQSVDKAGYEVIVVDNNSTDNTEEVIRSFIELYPNFRYVKEPKQGLSHARNRGWKEARGEYVAYIDDDGRAAPTWVDNIIGFTSRRPDIVVFGGPFKGFTLMKLPQWYKESYGEFTLGEEERPLRRNEWINGTNMVYKRSLLMELGGFNTEIGMSGKRVSYGEETNLLFKIRERDFPVFYVPSIVVEHLIADYKLSLRWFIKSRYAKGRDSWHTFMDEGRVGPLKLVLATTYHTMLSMLKFVRSVACGDHYKSAFVDSFWDSLYLIGKIVNIRKRKLKTCVQKK